MNANASSDPTRQDRSLVLVVEDDAMQRLLARASLERSGFAVAEAESGLDAMQAFEQLNPDLVLLDVQMPGMNGFQVCSRLRRTELGRHTPVLMMTGLDDLVSIKRAFDAGATDFAVKPLNWLILGHRVEYMLRANRTSEELRVSQEKLEETQRIAKLGYWEWDLTTDRLYCSAETQTIFDIKEEFLADGFNSLVERLETQDRRSALEWLQNLVAGQDVGEIEYRVQVTGKPSRHLRQFGEVVRQEGGEPLRVTGTVQDVTERRRAEERIQFLANYDALTGLPNRHSFSDTLHSVLVNATRREQRAGLLFLDIDRFKRINDTLGHQAGDGLLQQVADRLLELTHQSSRTDARSSSSREKPMVVSRFGGDEFVLLLPVVRGVADASQAARQVLRLFDRPFDLSDRQVAVSASIGVAIFPDDGASAELLMTNGDAAMYHAKAELGQSVQFYSKTMNSSALDRLVLESDLGAAVEKGEMAVWYQPQFDDGQRLVGAEALLRWKHSERGMILPDQFIPLAEESGQIVELGEWVLRQACTDSAQWQRDGLPPIRVSVNLSPLQLSSRDLLATVSNILDQSGLAPKYLALELTESLLLDDADAHILELLRALRKLGLRLCVDDFGTGYSSLSYLSRFPIDSLKIDRSFVQHLPEDHDQGAIVRAILAMAKSLKLQTVAEGVETEAQQRFLLQEGCSELQGSLLGKPMPADELVRRLACEPQVVGTGTTADTGAFAIC